MSTAAPDRVSVRSYLVHVAPGAVQDVAARLRSLTRCHVNPAVNRDVLVLVAETRGRAEADALDEALAATEGVLSASLVSGFLEAE